VATEATPDGSPEERYAAPSPVEVVEISEDTVTLDLPEDPRDCSRVIPEDLIDIGRAAWNWFAWDLQKKQPRAPHKNGGYAGGTQWGSDNVSWDGGRTGSTFGEVLDSLNDEVNGCIDPKWQWPDGDGEGVPDEDPRPLYPMAIVPHSRFQPDPALMLIDLDDVINPETGKMTREAWNVITRLDGFAEVSTSMTGVHVLVRARLPAGLESKKVIEDLDEGGQIEVYGYPGDGRPIGTTWMHIDKTPRDAVPHAQAVVEELIDEHVDEDEKLSEEEQAKAALDTRKTRTRVQIGSSGSHRSAYYALNPVPIAQTGTFAAHASGGQGPHPVHGGTTTPDSESTNFSVSKSEGWNCFAHDDGGGALQLIAVLEGIRSCGNASDVMQDPVDAMTTCLAARDKYTTDLDDENPPTAALKGVAEVMGLDYPDDGALPRATYQVVRDIWDDMQYDGGAD